MKKCNALSKVRTRNIETHLHFKYRAARTLIFLPRANRIQSASLFPPTPNPPSALLFAAAAHSPREFVLLVPPPPPPRSIESFDKALQKFPFASLPLSCLPRAELLKGGTQPRGKFTISRARAQRLFAN